MRRLLTLTLMVVPLAACDSDSSDPAGPGDPSDPPPVETVLVNPSEATLTEGESEAFSATLLDADGSELSGREVAWSTSSEEIATVSASGEVTAVGAGDPVTITATSEGRSGEASVTVVTPPTEWTVIPHHLGPGTASARVRGEQSFATLSVSCDATVDFGWTFTVRDVGEVPFTSGVEMTFVPSEPDDPSPEWSYSATSGTLYVGLDAAAELQELIRHRESAELVYPSGSPVEAVEVEFDLRAAGEALDEAEEICRSSD